jgi:predicted transcriptional regulator
MSKLLKALEHKLVGEVEVAKANVEVYMSNPVGIGEHPDLVGAVEEQLAKLAEADEKLETLRKYFPDEQPYTITLTEDPLLV